MESASKKMMDLGRQYGAETWNCRISLLCDRRQSAIVLSIVIVDEIFSLSGDAQGCLRSCSRVRPRAKNRDSVSDSLSNSNMTAIRLPSNNNNFTNKRVPHVAPARQVKDALLPLPITKDLAVY